MSLIDPGLLQILRCPETQQPLREADAVLLADVNARLSKGALKNRAGKVLADPLEGALLRQDGQVLYPIRFRIPILLIEEAVALG